MINFKKLEESLEDLKTQYNNSKPFPHIVIDNFCDPKIDDHNLDERSTQWFPQENNGIKKFLGKY